MSPRPLTDAERARLGASLRILEHAIRTPDPEEIAAAVKAGYPALELPESDAAQMKDTDPKRVRVYRNLVRATLKDVVKLEIPRAVARMGDVAYDDCIRSFFEEEMPRSRVLRDVAYEFVGWATPRWREDDSLEPCVADLARYELFEFDVYTAEREPPEAESSEAESSEPSDELAADQTLAFDGTVRIARFGHEVHELPDDPAEHRDPAARDVGVLAYRDREGSYRQLDLTPLATAIFGAMWREGRSLAEAIQRACAAQNRPLDQSVIDGTSTVIEDLSNRGVVLGGIPVSASPRPPSPWAFRLFDADAVSV